MASSSSPSSSSSRSWKYDVFLSFRGEDTRKTFVDHLYSALEQKTIRTYKDDVTLDRGDTIAPSLLEAIESSQILVIIFSENYADSSWCLDELSHIMKCKDSETGQIVMPIFYNVDPSDVRKQKGKYGEAFVKHELSENGGNKVESWKKALVDASNIAGWELKHIANGHEAKCIKEIVGSILDKLSSSDSTVEDENLVGMGIRLEQLKSQLRIGSGGVRMVGIWGLGGAGKTTLATYLYKKLKSSGQFHGCCFVENIREESKQQHGLKGLQEKILSIVFGKQMKVESVELGKDQIKQMLCHRIVLIVLDDVDHLEQLEALAGCRKWFGDGSRIIITTRDQQLLTSHRVDEVSPVSLLSHEEAVRLFRKHAYHEDNVVQDYEKLSLRVISYVNGLPLAVKILGAFLNGKDKDEWLSTLARLQDHPEMGIVEKLKISYDGLTRVEKELFLDIACFYRWKKKDDAIEKLDACGFYPAIGVKVLVQKALITVSWGYFDMHDLVQEMAHYIIRGEHPKNPEKHSRLWRKEDIEDICSKNATMENDTIEAINCDVIDCSSSSFIMLVSKLKKLRFLEIKNKERNYWSATMENDNIDHIECPATEHHVHQHRSCSSSLIMLVSKMKKLRFLQRYSQSFNQQKKNRFISSAAAGNDNSKMNKPRFPQVTTTSFDEGPSFLSNDLRYLYWYKYPGSVFPKSFQPNQLVVLKLERSLLKKFWKGDKGRHCQCLPSLEELELSWMKALERTPDFGGLPCLQKLTLKGCESLKEIHQSLGNHNRLVEVCVKECYKLTRFPSIVRMEKLETLEISECIALERTPDFGGLPCLQKLTLEGCESLKEIHQSLGHHNSLIHVYVEKCNKITRFPSIVRMDKLEILEISECLALDEFPKIEAKMDSLVELSLSYVGIEVLPSTIGEHCTNLISLRLSWCTKLKSIEGKFHALRKLELSWCGLKDGGIPKVVGELSSLRELHLKGNDFTRLDFSLSRLTSLKRLDLSWCENLVELPELPSSLAILLADGCDSLEAIVRDDIPINCKCLCDVSILIGEGRSNPIGWERLLETMLQGNAIESGCISLQLKGVQILRVFEPCFFKGKRCSVELPENWYNDFSGFLFFTASIDGYGPPDIAMKHEKLEDDVYLEKSDDDDKSVAVDRPEESDERKHTWVGYLPFGSLRKTLWWQRHTSSTAAIQFQFEFDPFYGITCGCKLIPKRSETTTSITLSGSSYDISDDYTCGLKILRDSKSTLECRIQTYSALSMEIYRAII